MSSCFERAQLNFNPFVLVRAIGSWEGRPSVDIVVVGLKDSALKHVLHAIECALERKTTLAVGCIPQGADDPILRLAIAPGASWYPGSPSGIRVHGVGNPEIVRGWLLAHELTEGYTLLTAAQWVTS